MLHRASDRTNMVMLSFLFIEILSDPSLDYYYFYEEFIKNERVWRVFVYVILYMLFSTYAIHKRYCALRRLCRVLNIFLCVFTTDLRSCAEQRT